MMALVYDHRLPREAVIESTEPDGDYAVTLREIITSPNATYEVLERLGRGTFGQVVKCWRKENNEIVAIKILKSTPSYAKQGQMEVDVLSKLSKLSSDDGSFVRAYESFQHCGHICIVFELLHTNLYDYLKQTRFEPLPLKYIRPIAQQVLSCLEKLGSLQLVHADLKPENIMLIDAQRYPFKVKVIDFGSAMSRDKATPSCYLQSRYYRAPEVVMGVPFNESIDMWSLGCVLAELYLGWPLFPGACEFDQITYICQTLGATGLNGLPSCLMRNTVKASRFFNCDTKSRQWSLKPASQYTQETGIQTKESRRYIIHSLLDLAQVPPPSSNNMDNQESILTSLDRMEFISLLSRMLTLDPKQRITPSAALQMPFITMQHLAMHIQTPVVLDWIQSMQVCRHTTQQQQHQQQQQQQQQLIAFPSSTQNCCNHFHLMAGTTATIQPSLFYPVVPQTHLVCHVAPSTLGYLPLTTTAASALHLNHPQTHHAQILSPWIDPQTCHAQILSPWIDPQTCQTTTSCRATTASQVFQDHIIQASTTSHLHANQIDASQMFVTTNKLMPLQLPAYHPFSRL